VAKLPDLSLPRTIPSGTKDAFVLLMAVAPCDFLFYGPCINALTYSRSYPVFVKVR